MGGLIFVGLERSEIISFARVNQSAHLLHFGMWWLHYPLPIFQDTSMILLVAFKVQNIYY